MSPNIEKLVPLRCDEGAVLTWIQWDGRQFRHTPKPPHPETWTLESQERYQEAAAEMQQQAAEGLTLIVGHASGTKAVPTSLQHRMAVVKELWYRDLIGGRLNYRAERRQRRKRKSSK